MNALATATGFTNAQAPSLPVAPRAVAAQQDATMQAARLTDAAMNLTRNPGELPALFDSAAGTGPSEFLCMLAGLLKQGVVGSEILEVRGERYTSFVDARIAAPREIAHARQYQEPIPTRRLNLAA